jgi:hypothetical protein
MRFTISPEQLKFFHTDGYLTLENLLSEKEGGTLLKAIETLRSHTPGYPEVNLSRSIPLIASLVRKRGWGEIAYELIQKKPLRIGYDQLFRTPPVLSTPLEEQSCGLIIDLDSREGFFFKNELPTRPLYKTNAKCYFFLIFTAKHLPEPMNPIVKR